MRFSTWPRPSRAAQSAFLKPGAGKRAVSVCAALAMAGCAAQQPLKISQRSSNTFSPSKYGPASPRVVADGQPVPVGGGRYQVGRPYTIAGKTYYPAEGAYAATGTASWYGDDFHGRRTANGEIFDKASITAAHPTLPLPSYARVTNLRNNASIVVRVNDRGPYHGGRVMDVSQRVAEALEFKNAGTTRVRVDYLSKASLGGSDYSKLLATLRQDGSPATLDGGSFAQPTLLAESAPPAAKPTVKLPPPPARAEPPAQAEQPPASEPETTTIAAAATPLPPVRPQSIKLAAAAVAELDPIETSSLAKAAPLGKSAPPARAPLPPLRPFDLGTIPGAGVPIAAPPAPAQKQASLVTYYDSSPIALTGRFVQRGPFEGLKPSELKPLNSRLD